MAAQNGSEKRNARRRHPRGEFSLFINSRPPAEPSPSAPASAIWRVFPREADLQIFSRGQELPPPRARHHLQCLLLLRFAFQGERRRRRFRGRQAGPFARPFIHRPHRPQQLRCCSLPPRQSKPHIVPPTPSSPHPPSFLRCIVTQEIEGPDNHCQP